MDSKVDADLVLNKFTKTIQIEPYKFKHLRTPIYSFLRLVWGQLLRSVVPANFTGIENIPKKGPIIFASNHLSHFDPLFMIVGSRKKLHFLAKHEHFERLVTKFIVKSTGQIKTVREEGGSDALTTASGVLELGKCMGIFPEGTRSKNSKAPFLGKGKTGIARLAASHPDAFIIPVVCEGTRNFMEPKKHKIPRFWRPVKINFGTPITWRKWISHEKGGNLNDENMKKLLNEETHIQKQKMSILYRRFTDQFMVTLKQMGAP